MELRVPEGGRVVVRIEVDDLPEEPGPRGPRLGLEPVRLIARLPGPVQGRRSVRSGPRAQDKVAEEREGDGGTEDQRPRGTVPPVHDPIVGGAREAEPERGARRNRIRDTELGEWDRELIEPVPRLPETVL